jgi:hypothetical protein
MKKIKYFFFSFSLLSVAIISANESCSYTVKDGGSRESFVTGAIREDRANKGRYDLISPIALRRLAIVSELGAKKYSERNWEKGMPMSRILDSAFRHLNQYMEGKRDEDHLAHAFWNIMAAIHFDELNPELNDLPMHKNKDKK